MIVHVFQLDDWYWDKSLDGWTANFSYLVIRGKFVITSSMPSNSIYWQERMRETFPFRIEHGTISRHRGKIENSHVLDNLLDIYPETWGVLNDWCEIASKRACVRTRATVG